MFTLTTGISFNEVYKRHSIHYFMNLLVHVRIFTMRMNTRTTFMGSSRSKNKQLQQSKRNV